MSRDKRENARKLNDQSLEVEGYSKYASLQKT